MTRNKIHGLSEQKCVKGRARARGGLVNFTVFSPQCCLSHTHTHSGRLGLFFKEIPVNDVHDVHWIIILPGFAPGGTKYLSLRARVSLGDWDWWDSATRASRSSAKLISTGLWSLELMVDNIYTIHILNGVISYKPTYNWGTTLWCLHEQWIFVPNIGRTNSGASAPWWFVDRRPKVERVWLQSIHVVIVVNFHSILWYTYNHYIYIYVRIYTYTYNPHWLFNPFVFFVGQLIIPRSKTADSNFVCETSIEHHCNRYSTALVLWTVDTFGAFQRRDAQPRIQSMECDIHLQWDKP